MRRPAPLAPLPRALLVLAGTIAFALLAWWLDRRMLGVAREAYFGFTPIFANALPGLLAALLLAVLTRRPGFSLFVVAGVQVLVYRVSEVKLAVLGDPLGLQDLYFITSPSAESFELLGAYLERPWLLAAGAVLLGALAGVAWWLERPAFRAFRWTHAGLALAGIALCASLVTARQPWSGVYDKDALHPSRFKAISSILHAGLMSNLVYTHLQNRQAVDTLDEAALARLFDTVPVRPGQVAPAGQRPDVVVILSESLFDPRRIEGMQSRPDIVPNVRATLAAGHGGSMQVPTFGGGTVRTEFEVLTGMPMDAFPDARFPYVTLVRGRIPSLVGALERHGYGSVAIHGNAGSFWNRQNAYHALGIDRFITKSEFPPEGKRDGRYYADSVMTDLILRELGRASAASPMLVVALSIEAHGPYRSDAGIDLAERDAISIPDGLSPAQASELRNYLYHARHADAQLGRLLQAINARGRPTVVLFFGDHLPGLGGIYDRLRFIDGKPARQQPVPFVLWRSDRPGATVVRNDAMQSWMLPGAVLALAGVADDPYFALTRAVGERLPSASRPEQGRLLRGINAAAVARLNGRFAERLEAHGSAAGEAR